MGCGCSSSGGSCGCIWKNYALTIVRVVLGAIFFMHGTQKVLGWFGGGGLTATVSGMTGMGLPAATVYAVCFGELLGGIGLIVGCLSRVAAAGVGIIMIGAVVTVHWQHGFFLNWFMTPNLGHGFEYNLALIAMSLTVLLGGPGACAIDNCWCKKCGM